MSMGLGPVERWTDMTSTPKRFSRVIAAALAIAAMTTSMAAADVITTEKSPAQLTGKQTGSRDFWSFTAGTVKCKEVNYSAETTTPTSSFSASPSIPVKTIGGEQNCSGFGFPTEVHTNGCNFKHTLGAGTTGTVDIICPAGSEITYTAVSSSTPKCIVHIPAQNGIATSTYKGVGSGTTREVEISMNLTGISYKHTAGTGIGACTSGSASNGTFVGGTL